MTTKKTFQLSLSIAMLLLAVIILIKSAHAPDNSVFNDKLFILIIIFVTLMNIKIKIRPFKKKPKQPEIKQPEPHVADNLSPNNIVLELIEVSFDSCPSVYRMEINGVPLWTERDKRKALELYNEEVWRTEKIYSNISKGVDNRKEQPIFTKEVKAIK